MRIIKSSRSKELFWIISVPKTAEPFIISVFDARYNLSVEDSLNKEILYQGTYDDCVLKLRKYKSQKRL